MNKNVFSTTKQSKVPATNTVNEAGGVAYALPDAAALAQYAMTGTFNGTFYASAEDLTSKVLELANRCDPAFVANLAIYSRAHGYMKDMPAVLVAVLLARRETAQFRRAFRGAIDDLKMVKNFVQAVRSGITGRKSLGSAAKNEVRRFLDLQSELDLFRGSIGNDPSLADVIKMVHPRPGNPVRANMYAYLLGKKYVTNMLPLEVRDFEAFKLNPNGAPPAVNFQFLSSIKMSPEQWQHLAGSMTWHTLRMNLNTLERNGALADSGTVNMIAKKLADRETIKKIRVFPYQIFAAYKNAVNAPPKVRLALQDALDVAVENVPEIGKAIIAVDISGSMGSPATGNRGTATSSVTCVEVGSLIASAFLRKNPESMVIPFNTSAETVNLNPRDSVVTNAEKMSRMLGGGTACSAALQKANLLNLKADMVFYVSDNMSWADFGTGSGSAMAEQWAKFKRRNPKAKLVLLDIQPYASSQVQTDKDVLNVGGFSDTVFEVVARFAKGETSGEHWVNIINNMEQ